MKSNLRIVIVDDEINIAENIKIIIDEYIENADCIGMAHKVNDAVKMINKLKPDLVLMDIDLREGTGFDVLEMLEERTFMLIFITAHNEFAIKAFELSALHYLLKPVSINALKEAVERCMEKVFNIKEEQFQVLQENFRGKQEKFILSTQSDMYSIDIEDIVMCESNLHQVTIYCIKDGPYQISKTLITMEKIFNEVGFARINNSVLINLKYFKKYERGKIGYIKLTVNFNEIKYPANNNLKVTEYYKEGFLASLNRYAKVI